MEIMTLLPMETLLPANYKSISSNTLTVNSGGTVTVENGITNNGDIVVEDNGSISSRNQRWTKYWNWLYR